MSRFAARTGLLGEQSSRRYLWTDAFAVCNFLGLERATGEGRYRELALRLVERVHRTLGRHRGDDGRAGWLSGLPDREAERHPTRGGLRIGKPLPERRPGEPIDDREEWDRDGQYFHYLTKWMHALDQVAHATGMAIFNAWARELAEVAHRAFTHAPRPGAPKRMYWKMSIDLSRPLVAAMGQHDPLDGYVTTTELDETARLLGPAALGPRLSPATADFGAMIDRAALATDDPLGLGGLLADAFRIDQLAPAPAPAKAEELLGSLLDTALVGIRRYVRTAELRRPAEHRLGFRELGLAIGLAAIPVMQRARPRGGALDRQLAELARYVSLGQGIEGFWLRPEHRQTETWLAHEDINDVMLATSLVPEGFLVIRP